MSRMGVSLAVLTLALTALAGQAQASPGDKDVARMVSFGGMCVSCELSGRKLTGAKFAGANFDRAVLIGADLRGAAFYGSNFSGADLT
ncbi:MAG TPA: pentapeptide repeat-containing protein, partial [Caulobacter sp.]|nr:pentapeptide repeat-containing protein [Caulobacter sp.]